MTKRIVIVEDSQLQAARIQRELVRYGLSVDVAHTGEQGLERIRAIHPAVAILDVHLPDLDGYTICQTLKTDPDTAAIPVIMLTSRSEDEVMTEGLNVGADVYIPKDAFALQNLVEMLRQMGFEALSDAPQQ